VRVHSLSCRARRSGHRLAACVFEAREYGRSRFFGGSGRSVSSGLPSFVKARDPTKNAVNARIPSSVPKRFFKLPDYGGPEQLYLGQMLIMREVHSVSLPAHVSEGTERHVPARFSSMFAILFPGML
jgi:hypothetical protein